MGGSGLGVNSPQSELGSQKRSQVSGSTSQKIPDTRRTECGHGGPSRSPEHREDHEDGTAARGTGAGAQRGQVWLGARRSAALPALGSRGGPEACAGTVLTGAKSGAAGKPALGSSYSGPLGFLHPRPCKGPGPGSIPCYQIQT